MPEDAPRYISDAEADDAFRRSGIDAKVAAVPADLVMKLGRAVLKAAFAADRLKKPQRFQFASHEHPETAVEVEVTIKKK